MSQRHTVLIVDDEADIRALIRILLEKDGYAVIEAEDGRAALTYTHTHADTLSLIILDIMMPVMDGVTTAAHLREMTDVPILFLTARSSDIDKARAYHNGGDDYMVKPFHATDLRLKVGAMVRRYRMYLGKKYTPSPTASPDSLLLPGGIEIRTEERTVLRGDERIPLTDREYALLAHLCTHRGQNVTPAELYEAVWAEPYLSTSSNTVIVHIANLRRKLEADPSSPTLIRTVWGKGYRID